MRVFKNLLGDGSKIHASEIAVGDQAAHDTLSNVLNNFKVVAQGRDAGVVVSMDLPSRSIYLFLMGRDGGVYFIHNDPSAGIVITDIVPFTGNLNFNVSGNHLEIDFVARARSYVLVRLS